MSVDELERSLDSLHWQLWIWTFCVFLGLVVELSQEVLERATELTSLRDLLSEPKRGILSAIIGVVLITLGVAGELHVETRTARVEGSLRIANDTTLSIFKERADAAEGQVAAAKRDAAQANERAANAEKELAGAQRDAALARKEAEGYQAQIAKSNADAADARRQAADDNLRLAELQAELLPRRVTPQQRTMFLDLLGKSKGIPKVYIWGDMTVSDRIDFGKNLLDSSASEGVR
jgi:hypothetical protein